MKKVLRIFVLVIAVSLSLAIPAFATGGFETPPFSIDRTCDGAHYLGTVPDGSTGELQAELWTADPWLGGSHVWDTTVPIGQGPFDEFIPWGVAPDGLYYRVAIAVDGTVVAAWEAFLDCPPPPPSGEYCSPGYYRNHLDAWVGYSPGDDFDTVFGVDYFDPDITLGEAIVLRGGDVNALARTGTAALLSAADPNVNYPLSEAEVIAAVQAGDKATLDQFVEFACPLE